MRHVVLTLMLLVAGCGGVALPRTAVTSLSGAPEFPRQSHPIGLARSNVVLSADFLDLMFTIESGQPIPVLLRREAPVRVYVRSPDLLARQGDLQSLLQRLRREAGIDIATTGDEATANMFLESVPPAGLQRAVPNAACFLAPGVRSWAEYTALPRSDRPRWSQQTALTVSSVFIPQGISPQEIRDCFHEEVAQSLGPVNDLYRLGDSVFNDDNLHSVLTAFDMTILRALYSSDLATGMSRPAVAARILAVLDDVNPQGISLPPRFPGPQPEGWKPAIETALMRNSNNDSRIAASAKAVELAQVITPMDHRLALSQLVMGRLILKEQPDRAARLFTDAYSLSLALGDPVRSAHAGLHVAVIALANRQFDLAVEIADANLEAARQAENATLLSGFEAIRAESLQQLGQDRRAAQARRDSQFWSVLAFGNSQDLFVEAQAQIAGMAPTDGVVP